MSKPKHTESGMKDRNEKPWEVTYKTCQGEMATRIIFRLTLSEKYTGKE